MYAIWKILKYVLTRLFVSGILLDRKEVVMAVKKLLSILHSEGWIKVRQRGSHIIMKKGSKTLPIPNHRGDIAKGTLHNIFKSAGIVR